MSKASSCVFGETGVGVEGGVEQVSVNCSGEYVLTVPMGEGVQIGDM